MEFEDLQRNFMEMQEAAVVGSQDSSRNESKELARAAVVYPPGLPPPIPPQDSEVRVTSRNCTTEVCGYSDSG